MASPIAGAGRVNLRRRLAQVRDRADLLDRTVIGIGDGDRVAVGRHVEVVDGVVSRRERLGGDIALGAEDLHPLVAGLLLHPLEDPVAHFLRCLRRPLGLTALPLFLGEQQGQVGGVHEGVEEVLEQVAELDPASVAGHHRVIVQRRHSAADVEDLRVDLGLALGELGQQQEQQIEWHQALQQRRLDDLSEAAALALDQGCEDALHGALRGPMRSDGHGGKARTLAIALTREGHHPPRLGRGQRLVRRVLRIWTGRAEAGNRAEHCGLVERSNVRVFQSSGFRLRWGIRRHDHIRLADQVFQPSALGHHVQLHRPLASQPHRRCCQRSPGVAARRLELDDLGAEVGEDHGRDTADGPNGKIQNVSLSQWWGHVRLRQGAIERRLTPLQFGPAVRCCAHPPTSGRVPIGV